MVGNCGSSKKYLPQQGHHLSKRIWTTKNVSPVPRVDPGTVVSVEPKHSGNLGSNMTQSKCSKAVVQTASPPKGQPAEEGSTSLESDYNVAGPVGQVPVATSGPVEASGPAMALPEGEVDPSTQLRMLTWLSDDTPPLLQYGESANLPGRIAASAVHAEQLPELPGSPGKTTRSNSPSDGGADVNVTPGASGAISLLLHERMSLDTLTYLDQALADLDEDESDDDYAVVGPVGMVLWMTILGGKTVAEDDKRTKILLLR
ncbi:hypothetical protein BD311DRAFT_811476 [Dichomitus squalens]|uniref:Uncharacterized protein n=1 Tax=Dichomitus squalens TaxID=114155 RepID=A0A4Q9M6B2_9APHY|nr:hypothetical protein BD311DRAFT_811476 [Dichomitus squalens]